jgi:hypothetical protein
VTGPQLGLALLRCVCEPWEELGWLLLRLDCCCAAASAGQVEKQVNRPKQGIRGERKGIPFPFGNPFSKPISKGFSNQL